MPLVGPHASTDLTPSVLHQSGVTDNPREGEVQSEELVPQMESEQGLRVSFIYSVMHALIRYI